MLINLSNHLLSKWDKLQREAAENTFGEIVDLPFPQVKPQDSLKSVTELVAQYTAKCAELIGEQHNQDLQSKQGSDQPRNAIHVMGEYTFTYQFVKEMERRGILCVASTTERRVVDSPDGSKTTYFDFVQFRPYNEV